MENTNDKTAVRTIMSSNEFLRLAMAYRAAPDGGAAEAGQALANAVDKWGDARAEEARREERKLWAEANNALAQIADAVGLTGGLAEMVTAVRKLATQRTAGGNWRAAAGGGVLSPSHGGGMGSAYNPASDQRGGMTGGTAGGDAAELMEVAEACVSQGCTIAMEDHLEAKGMPVAEAAAQADGWRDALRRSGANTDYHGHIAFTPRQFESFVSMLGAAPTAQPTPEDDLRHEALEREHLGDFDKSTGIYAKNTLQDIKHRIEELGFTMLPHTPHGEFMAFAKAVRAIEAQPTPPDDELIRGFDLSLASVDAHDPQSFIDGAKWAEQKIRAALRQPGAKP